MNKSLLWYPFILLFLHGCGGGGDGSGSTQPAPAPAPPSFNLSGTLFATSNTLMDSDINDVNAPYRNNDDPSNPQVIPNPVILGGYVNEVIEGNTGQSYRTGDIDDYYEVELLAGQQITLLIASENLDQNDIDLGLLDLQQNLLDASVSAGNTESLDITQDGRYLIQVQAYIGASNYVLMIGQTPRRISAQPNTPPLRLSDDFVPGEVTVRFKPRQGLSLQSVSPLLMNMGLQQVAGEPQRRMLMRVNHSQAFSAQSQALQNRPAPRFKTLKQQNKYDTLMAVKALRRDQQVESASPNYRMQTLQAPNDRLYPRQWHYPLINLPQAWDITTGSSNVIVAVIDTGIISQHPDLTGRLVAGFDFVRDTDYSLDGDGIDSNPEDPGDQSPGGSSFHGTHVAGTVAANSNNGIGVAGVSWQTRIMPLRVLGRSGVGDDYGIEQAMRFAAGLPNDSNTVPAQKADIINLSLGGPAISSGFQRAVSEVRAAGVIIVAAAGNDGNRTINYPAALDGVLSVAAVDSNKERASYSNFNASVSLAAPGGSGDDLNGDGAPDTVISASGEESFFSGVQATYTGLIGTSMATPHVAGVLALMKAVNPTLSPDDVDQLLRAGSFTEDLGDSGKDNEFGYGLIDAQKAVQIALTSQGRPLPSMPAQLGVNPSVINLGTALNTANIELRNNGGDSLQILRIENDNTDALSLQNMNVNGDGLGYYRLNLQRANQASGNYQAKLRFVSNINTVEIAVLWQMGSSFTGNVGTQYVLLTDAFGEVVAQQQVQVDQGRYPYSFINIPAGNYSIISGSDNNNNDLVCEAGESCGAYLTLASPRDIALDSDLSGLDFDVSFDTQFLSFGVMRAPLVKKIRE